MSTATGAERGRRLHAGARRAAAALVLLVAASLAAVEVAGIIDGLHTQREKGTIEVSTIVIVQGVIGIPALLLALTALLRAGGTLARPERRIGAGVALAAVVVGVLWAYLYVSAYGS